MYYQFKKKNVSKKSYSIYLYFLLLFNCLFDLFFWIAILGHGSPQKSSFWKYGTAAYEYIPSFGSYQLATRSQTPNVKDDDEESVDNILKQDEVSYCCFQPSVIENQTVSKIFQVKHLISFSPNLLLWIQV